MPRYERSEGGRSSSRGGSRGRSGGRSFGGSRGGGSRGGGFGGDRERREVEMTEVTCADCGEKCKVPFKPKTSKPVYCSDCFSKNKGGSSGSSGKDISIINEKLDKIMKALKIE